jgi:hypothetical protein
MASESGKCTLYDAMPDINDQLSPFLQRTLKFVSLRVTNGDAEAHYYKKQGRTVVPDHQIFLLCECNCPAKDHCFFPRKIESIYSGVESLVAGHLQTCGEFKSGAHEHEESPFGIKRSGVGKKDWADNLRQILVEDGLVVRTKPLSLSDDLDVEGKAAADTATAAHISGPSEDSAGEKENVSPNSPRDTVSCSMANLSLVDVKGHIESSTFPKTRRRTRSQYCSGGHCRSCAVCSRGELPFAPLVLFCMNCSTRIRQGRTYYCSDAFTCCNKCYPKLDSDVKKKDGPFVQKKNEPQNERWKQCENSTCNNWVHFSCGLFNPIERHEGLYSCPLCLVEDLEAREEAPIEAPSSFPSASVIPHTALSRRLEDHVNMLQVGDSEVQRLVKEKAQKNVCLWYSSFTRLFCFQSNNI